MEEDLYLESEEPSFAVLDIKIVRAELCRSTNSFYKMDPYCKLVHLSSGTKIKTKKCSKGNKTPLWDHRESMLITDQMAADLRFVVSVMNKNSFGKNSIIGQSALQLDYITQVKTQEADFPLLYKNKLVGRVFIDLEYKDGTEFETQQRFESENYQEEVFPDPEDFNESESYTIENALNYEYSPVANKKAEDESKAKSAGDRVIQIDQSLSPLEANLALNKTPMWFKFNSSEVFRFNYEEM